MTPYWIQTYTGRAFDLNDPQPQQVSIEDIAHALSLICRFTGHCGKFYSVAEHSVLVSRYCQWPTEGLMHDAAEAYVGDVSNPLKRLLSHVATHTHSSLASDLYYIEERVHHTISARFLLDYGGKWSHIKDVDIRACKTEALALLGPSPQPWDPVYESAQPFHLSEIQALPPRAAERLFLDRAAACGIL